MPASAFLFVINPQSSPGQRVVGEGVGKLALKDKNPLLFSVKNCLDHGNMRHQKNSFYIETAGGRC